jgi:hypothetical protein
MINAKLQSIIDTKSAIGNAIVNKGGTITGETPFFNYAAQIDGISTGTPQTIFAASDGSKWARTNAVNLTNVSNNVTSDFNYWQPANNSTSDPILNIGTVGANISGNIRLVPVNQVNIAQYANIVATDNNGAKYVGFNGYDANTNPTPNGNTTFNRWLLNNSATGTVLFANATFVNGGTFNGPNFSSNESNLAFIGNTDSYGGTIFSVITNNGFIYVGGGTVLTIKKFNESNLAFVGNTASYGGTIFALTVNNGFVYAGGSTTRDLKKYHESNLAFVGNSQIFGDSITAIKINNGFIYLYSNNFTKLNESTLETLNSVDIYNATIATIGINNGFIYVGGQTASGINRGVTKIYESNLVVFGNTVNYGGPIRSIDINNGFIYVGGETNQTIHKYYESNLAFFGNTVGYGGDIETVKINNGFIYVGGATNQRIQKFYESNLAFVNSTNNYGGIIRNLALNNNFIYAGGSTNLRVQKFQQSSTIPETLSFFNITTIKE